MVVQGWHTEKIGQFRQVANDNSGSLTGAGIDVGDLHLCRFGEFVDGLRRDDVVVRMKTLKKVERLRRIL